jgi:hypothetical protein
MRTSRSSNRGGLAEGNRHLVLVVKLVQETSRLPRSREHVIVLADLVLGDADARDPDVLGHHAPDRNLEPVLARRVRALGRFPCGAHPLAPRDHVLLARLLANEDRLLDAVHDDVPHEALVQFEEHALVEQRVGVPVLRVQPDDDQVEGVRVIVFCHCNLPVTWAVYFKCTPCVKGCGVQYTLYVS